MNNFTVIYKILKYLESALDVESPDLSPISADRLGVSRERWEQLLIMLQDSGYISGLVIGQILSDNRRYIAEPARPSITLRGLEYLTENSLMKRAASLAKGVISVVKP